MPTKSVLEAFLYLSMTGATRTYSDTLDIIFQDIVVYGRQLDTRVHGVSSTRCVFGMLLFSTAMVHGLNKEMKKIRLIFVSLNMLYLPSLSGYHSKSDTLTSQDNSIC